LSDRGRSPLDQIVQGHKLFLIRGHDGRRQTCGVGPFTSVGSQVLDVDGVDNHRFLTRRVRSWAFDQLDCWIISTGDFSLLVNSSPIARKMRGHRGALSVVLTLARLSECVGILASRVSHTGCRTGY
jgi:hypothetical protein